MHYLHSLQAAAGADVPVQTARTGSTKENGQAVQCYTERYHRGNQEKPRRPQETVKRRKVCLFSR